MKNIIQLHQSNNLYAVRAFLENYGLQRKPPQLAFLKESLYHFTNLPYENISKIIKLNQFVAMSDFSIVENLENQTPEQIKTLIRFPDEVIEEHFSRHLGGTCFSLTYFLQEILTDVGFICYPIMADMQAGENIHCALMVLLNNSKFLVDPGYLLTTPMELDPKRPRLYKTNSTGVEVFFDADLGYYNLFTFNKMETKWRYRFIDRPTPMGEFLHHWLASFTKPAMHGITLTKITKNGYIYVRKNFMREQTLEKKTNYNLKKNYHQTIRNIFGIEPEIIEQAKSALKENMEKERSILI